MGIPSMDIDVLRYAIYIKKQIFLYNDTINLFGTLKCKFLTKQLHWNMYDMKFLIKSL